MKNLMTRCCAITAMIMMVGLISSCTKQEDMPTPQPVEVVNTTPVELTLNHTWRVDSVQYLDGNGNVTSTGIPSFTNAIWYVFNADGTTNSTNGEGTVNMAGTYTLSVDQLNTSGNNIPGGQVAFNSTSLMIAQTGDVAIHYLTKVQ